MRAPRLIAPLTALLCSVAVLPAAAEDAGSAKDLHDKAHAALSAGDTAGACVLFKQEVQALKAAGGLGTTDYALFELAECYEKLGYKAMAAATFAEVAGARQDEAKKRAEALGMGPSQAPLPAPTPASIATLTGGPPPTRLGDFMDTRLSWTFGDDDILHATGQAIPLSPNFSIGDRKQYRLFFDNLNSRFGGRENVTHLVVYKKMPAFFKNLDTEASMVMRLDAGELATNTNNLNKALYDAGSFIRLFYHTDGNADGKTGLGLTLWPIDTDRFRLGYLYDLSWGGTNGYINQSIFPRIQGSSPGAKLQYDGDGWSVYGGFKTASIVQVEQVLTPGTSEVEQLRMSQTNVGLLGGGSVELTDFLRLDAGGGFFQQGKLDLPDVVGRFAWTAGLSARVVFHHKEMAVPQSIDFQLYRNDLSKPMILFKPEEYTPGKTTWLVSAEYDNLFQHLKDFDVTGGTKVQQARAAALQANLKSGFLRASLTGIYRDLPYVLRNQPSMIPFETIPKDAIAKPEFFLAAASDYYFEHPRLTAGLGAGVQFPASFNSNEVGSASAPIARTVVVREIGNFGILPVGKGAVPIVQARISLKWDISRILSAIVWGQYVRDNNATFVERDPSDGAVSLRAFLRPDFFGLGTSMQARF